MTHLIAGYPSIQESKEIALTMAAAGTDILEIQIPFSDPIADGPAIAKANEEALKKGITTEKALQLIAEIATEVQSGHIGQPEIAIMTYFNILYNYGIEKFCAQAKASGASHLIIPDYPFDEEAHNDLHKFAQKNNLNIIPVIAPTTSLERFKEIPQKGGFVYCTARAGLTGQKTAISEQLKSYLTRLRTETQLPLAVGFGIRTKEQIDALSEHADIAVAGSVFIDKTPEECRELIKAFKK